MNKEKLIVDAIKEKAYRVNRTARPVYGQGQYDMAYEILEDVQKIIQSEPQETCTYSKDQVAELILEYALDLENSKNFACDMETDDVLYWINEKAGE